MRDRYRGPARACIVGLTGGLASGKSTAARLLAGLGAAVLDADAVVHELYGAEGEGARIVAGLFGKHVLGPDGAVDREALSRVVLAGGGAIDRLNRAIHPLVRRRIAAWVGGLEPSAVAVVEATLMVETGSFRDYDVLAVVWCRPEQQLERALRRGVPEGRARSLLAAQMPLDDKRRLADIVIDNSGGEAELPAEVARAWEEIRARCR